VNRIVLKTSPASPRTSPPLADAPSPAAGPASPTPRYARAARTPRSTPPPAPDSHPISGCCRSSTSPPRPSHAPPPAAGTPPHPSRSLPARREAHHRPHISLADFPLHRVRVALRQIPAEIQRAVPMDLGVGPLHLIQDVADLLRRHRRMIEERHKLLERALEVDVVLPQRVVGIDDQVLARHNFGRGARWKGISKMASTYTAMPSRRAGVNSHFASASCALRSRRSSS